MLKRILLIITVFSFMFISIGATTRSSLYNHQFIKTTYRDNTEIKTIISSKEELKSFYKKNKELLYLEHREKVYADSTIGFIDVIEKYDEKYFKKNNLALIYFTEHSGSITHEINDISINEEIIYISIKQNYPEYLTCDMAGWLLILEIEKGLNVTDFITKMKG